MFCAINCVDFLDSLGYDLRVFASYKWAMKDRLRLGGGTWADTHMNILSLCPVEQKLVQRFAYLVAPWGKVLTLNQHG